ncbi:MAG: hypothetical protein OEM59_01070 [Rhodospirillales bacterium]|nr:hypothetical protein [Rhodospirillales bacterium]
MTDFSVYVNTDRFFGSSSWRSRLAETKRENQQANPEFEDVPKAVLSAEFSRGRELPRRAVAAINSKHRFRFSA